MTRMRTDDTVLKWENSVYTPYFVCCCQIKSLHFALSWYCGDVFNQYPRSRFCNSFYDAFYCGILGIYYQSNVLGFLSCLAVIRVYWNFTHSSFNSYVTGWVPLLRKQKKNKYFALPLLCQLLFSMTDVTLAVFCHLHLAFPNLDCHSPSLPVHILSPCFTPRPSPYLFYLLHNFKFGVSSFSEFVYVIT